MYSALDTALARLGIDPSESATKIAEVIKIAVSSTTAAELLAMASRGRRPIPVSAVAPVTGAGHALQSLVGHRPPPVPVSAVRMEHPEGWKQVLTAHPRSTNPTELGAALRKKTQVQGAQQLAEAMGFKGASLVERLFGSE